MRQRDPFGAALTGLRTAIEHGLAPGQHLSVADISASLSLSTSPVREALSRLCGEGLVEDRRGLGYFTRIAPLEDILGLLDLEAVHIRLAALTTSVAFPGDDSDPVIEAWIEAVIDGCENEPLLESLARVRRRLAPLRKLHGPTPAEVASGEADPLAAYYARWRVAAGALAARLRKLNPEHSEYTRNIV